MGTNNGYSRNDRWMPSSYVQATIAVFIGLCLVGMLILSNPFENGDTGQARTISLDKEKTTVGMLGDSNGGNMEKTELKIEETSHSELPTMSRTVEKEGTEYESKDRDFSQKDPEHEDNSGDEPSLDAEKQEKEIEVEGNGGAQSEIQIEENKENLSSWETQATESEEEKEKEKVLEVEIEKTKIQRTSEPQSEWKLCSFEGATDYIPCLDNKEAIRNLPDTKHYEHRERHCPSTENSCLVPLPKGYLTPIKWPQSRNEIWYNNVPHPGLVSYKKDQNWVRSSGEKLLFPGGGTQFKHGAIHYIDFIEQTLPNIAWGTRTRVVLDVGCGVASFGGYILDRGVLTMSFAPKDEHEAQIQLALERGIPAILAVMGTQRLPFPSNVFDAIHCARCRVPWHIDGGKLLLELNRVLRPGGYFLWSATPVYLALEEDREIWKEMEVLTAAMCWELVAKRTDSSTGVGIAIYQKPTSNVCYENRKVNYPPVCDDDDKADASWYIPMNACIHRIPSWQASHGLEWPQAWPLRLTSAPAWLNDEKGLYGKPAAADFRADTEHWHRVVEKSYLPGLGIDWTSIRNVIDMNAGYGGFAAALGSQPLWVMNVIQYDAPDTLPIVYDRGLFGIYHDWCESFNSYPRTYDLLHADHLFTKLKERCGIKSTIVEMDRLLRPQGWAIFRDGLDNIGEIESITSTLHWNTRLKYAEESEGLLVVQKTDWRPRRESMS